jgi:predicted Zn finger-like uncharacterized protein
MIIICEECGKKYRIDPEKIRGSEAKFSCRTCSHEIIIHKPEEQPEPSPSIDFAAPTSSQPPAVAVQEPPSRERSENKPSRKLKLGVRGKMIFLFFLLPGMISGLAALYTITQIHRTADSVVEASTSNLRHIAELVVANESRLLAERVGEYLHSRAGIRPADLAADETMKKVLSRNISWGGAAFIYTLPEPASTSWRTWAHSDAKLVGMTLDSMQKPLGDGYPEFLKIYSGVKSTPLSKGYFQTINSSASAQETYMVARLIQGTPFVVAVTAPVDQMLSASRQIKDVAEYQVYTSSLVTAGLMLFAFLLIGITVTLYGHGLTSRIKYLTDVSDRISVGDLETEIKLKTDDEIGALAESISRMQDSLRISIERLRRRR